MTAQSLADQWIPIRAGTDSALMDAMAFVMLSEGLHDQAFLDRYCVGFDEEHLPEGAPPGSSYKSYVLGQSDGVPQDAGVGRAVHADSSRDHRGPGA